MTELHKLHSYERPPRLVSEKGSPARPAVSACSVQVLEAPKLNIVYRYPQLRHMHLVQDKHFSMMAQTMQSDLGTCQMLWEEPPSSSSGSTVTLLEDTTIEDSSNGLSTHNTGMPNPLMEKLKTKLTAWTWERERAGNFEERPRWIPLMKFDEHRRGRSSDHLSSPELPPGPPNTERHSGQSSAKHSTPQTPAVAETDEEDENPIELKIKSAAVDHTAEHSARHAPMKDDYLTVPLRRYSVPTSSSVPHQLSNLAAEDTHFQFHRDSIDLQRQRMRLREVEGNMNQHLMNARDSFVLAQAKFDVKYPRPLLSSSAIGFGRFGGLSPILDASPPAGSNWPSERTDSSSISPTVAKEEHSNCPICEVDRPRWFEERYRTW